MLTLIQIKKKLKSNSFLEEERGKWLMEVKRDTTLMEDSLALIHQNCKCICPLTQQSQF